MHVSKKKKDFSVSSESKESWFELNNGHQMALSLERKHMVH